MTVEHLYLALGVLCTAFGQLYFKKYVAGKYLVYLCFALVLFVATTGLNYLALKGLSIDLVYISTSATILMVIILSAISLKENITSRHWFGCVLIAAGIIIYASG